MHALSTPGRTLPRLGSFSPAPAPVEPPAPAVVAPVIEQTVTVTTVAARTDLLADETQWSWQELRDYVVAQIEQRFGAFPRDAKKEYGIFTRYLRDHGTAGIAAAKYAFEFCDGWWAGAPVSVNRFCKKSDPFFVLPITERLADVS